MPAGPFASSVGVGRAEPEWAALNKVTGVCGEGTRAPPDQTRVVSRERPHLVFLFLGTRRTLRRAARRRVRPLSARVFR